MNNHNNITIRPIDMNDYDYVVKWSKDEAFCLANQWALYREQNEIYQWWLKCVTHKTDNFVGMAIEVNGKCIGYTDLANIRDEVAELGIAIGESTLWGQGIGIAAALSTLAFAYTQLGITTFEAETHETNIRSRRLLEKIGFEEISRIGFEDYIGNTSRLLQYRFIYKN